MIIARNNIKDDSAIKKTKKVKKNVSTKRKKRGGTDIIKDEALQEIIVEDSVETEDEEEFPEFDQFIELKTKEFIKPSPQKKRKIEKKVKKKKKLKPSKIPYEFPNPIWKLILSFLNPIENLEVSETNNAIYTASIDPMFWGNPSTDFTNAYEMKKHYFRNNTGYIMQIINERRKNYIKTTASSRRKKDLRDCAKKHNFIIRRDSLLARSFRKGQCTLLPNDIVFRLMGIGRLFNYSHYIYSEFHHLIDSDGILNCKIENFCSYNEAVGIWVDEHDACFLAYDQEREQSIKNGGGNEIFMIVFGSIH